MERDMLQPFFILLCQRDILVHTGFKHSQLKSEFIIIALLHALCDREYLYEKEILECCSPICSNNKSHNWEIIWPYRQTEYSVVYNPSWRITCYESQHR